MNEDSLADHASQLPLVIYGAGGHGQVVAEAAQLAGWQVLGFVDDDPGSVPLLDRQDPKLQKAAYIVAIGDNTLRENVIHRLVDQGMALASVVHPTAFVSPLASLDAGVFVGPMAVVHTRATLGQGVIVNSAAVVEHDNILRPFSHIAPGAVLGGSVAIGARTLVGLGARVLPGVHVGEGCIVGAGAVVTREVEKGQTVLGVPARHP